MEFEATIGLEVHCQLGTNTKLFCGCTTLFAQEPNSQTCPVCLGHPGTLPVLNKKVFEYAVKAGLAIGCDIQKFSKFDRKNYYYPDLPKAYQITQFDKPFALKGGIEINIKGNKRVVKLERIQIEEDAGKLIHTADGSLVDLNRAGTPLIEIVSDPDMSTSEEAYQYLVNLKKILKYNEVSDCEMQEGSLRCDANISVKPIGQKELGTKVEVKNLNSFRYVQAAIDYEIVRQIQDIQNGNKISQETRLWDVDNGVTEPMRSKEGAHDYRFFPEPDLPPLILTDKEIEKIKSTVAEPPLKRKERFISELKLSEYDASILTEEKPIADYFENALKEFNKPKEIANWISNDISSYLNEKKIGIDQFPVSIENMTSLWKLIDDGTINKKIAKEKVFPLLVESNKNPSEIIESEGLAGKNDSDEIRKWVEEAMAKNQKAVDDLKNGKDKAKGSIVGMVMKASKGLANPQIVNKIIDDIINS
ncbi:MAG: Asp-tRNA(Asn)/Glu-tRNA(Gln) amidotransferase GatCAB subunit B [Planctomycetota bacterium]|nr:MAG: Asp-tRNA(Asn)/Glu-tRNA(Gln) amidotransferase GatCAB subunit B [Planctomycetota bacterium]